MNLEGMAEPIVPKNEIEFAECNSEDVVQVEIDGSPEVMVYSEGPLFDRFLSQNRTYTNYIESWYSKRENLQFGENGVVIDTNKQGYEIITPRDKIYGEYLELLKNVGLWRQRQ